MTSRGKLASLVAAVAAFGAAPPASAATLSVDDDGRDCPAAVHQSVQAAIDAAGPGDTVAICPGLYIEGSGAVGSNALTVTKSLTLKGAGADRVRIMPRRTTETSGQIAEASPDIRNGVGDILVAQGPVAAPITVNASGITFDGNGVYVEAGLVYIDASGTLSRNRVTNVVTSEAADAESQPGGWRGPQPGYGIAQVSRAVSTPAGNPILSLTIDNNRIDRYNRAGVLIDGSTATAGYPTDARGVVNASEVVGRVLCQSYTADGNCYIAGNQTQNGAPGFVTTGTLFGQDGVRIAYGARGTIKSSLISQNLVQGTGAPMRGTAASPSAQTTPSSTNNANLYLGAGIRLLGANAAASLITSNNIVDNAYGVYNAEADGTTPAAQQVEAPNNWWGLRSNVPADPNVPNPGPAISPATNPPTPENPVNGSPLATPNGTTSTTVDFLPYRNGAQANPTSGEFPNIQAPMPVGDAAPTVALAADKAAYAPGDAVVLTATAADDFGVKRATFFDGATRLGSDDLPAYTWTATIPADAACGERTFSVVAQDSANQTRSASVTVAVTCPAPGDGGGGNGGGTGGGTAPGAAPAFELAPGITRIKQHGTVVPVTALKAPNGVAEVAFFLGERRLCTLTAAPYVCRVLPKAAEIGVQALRAVVTDKAGLATTVSRDVTVDRFKSRGLAIKIKTRRISGGRVQRTFTVELKRPSRATAADVCIDSRVTVVVRRRGQSVVNRQRRLDWDCTARVRAVLPKASKRIYSVEAGLATSPTVLATSKTRRFS